MNKTVFIASAQDAVGIQIAKDFLRHGWRVLCGCRTVTELPAGMRRIEIDPTSPVSIASAVDELGEDAIDLLVVNLDYRSSGSVGGIRTAQNYEELLAAYDYNAVAPIRLIQAFLPLLERGEMKRICVVTTADGSNNACYATSDYLNHTTKAALNMGVNILFNDFRPEGYTFRIFCKDKERPEESVKGFATAYFTMDRSDDPTDPKHSDENRLVLRDWMGRELPW